MMLAMMLALLAAPVDSARCWPTGATPAIRAVQTSAALDIALRALDRLYAAEGRRSPTRDPRFVASACSSVQVDRPPLLRGRSIARARMRPGVEDLFAIFGVDGDRVILLNPTPAGRLEAGLDVPAWNRFVSASLRLESDSDIVWYAWGVAALATNYGPRPSPPCATDSVVVVRLAHGARSVYIDRLHATVVEHLAGEVDSVSLGRRLHGTCPDAAGGACRLTGAGL